nr:8007_t:CDS:2 [Entrophospora candida]CAG8441621.1 3598_t:CDS:2 [Entrophospora candida]
MPKKHNNSISKPNKNFNFKEVTITFSPITVLLFILTILSAIYNYDKYYKNQETCQIVVPIEHDDKYQWFSAPEHLTSTASYKSLDNGAFVYRHIFMDEFQEEFNVKPIQFPNETEGYIYQSISASSERYAPSISSLKKRVEEGTYVDDGSVYIRWVNDDVRYGMFAGKDFKPGDVIGIYAGVITPSSNDLEYAWEYNYLVDVKDEDGKKIAVCIDGKHSGNYMRFANHRDDNQNGGQLYIVHDDMWNVVYTAHTHIKTHEQIFVNYGQAYWNIVIVVNSDDGDESVEANFF